jgi:filamentous hemagglutinin
MNKSLLRKVGAGGFWKVFNEKKDVSVVKQITPLSCVAAVGEMILQKQKILMTQKEIIDIIGEASTTEKLAELLNRFDESSNDKKWYGVIIAVRFLQKVADESFFGAVLREGSPLGHLVLVESFEDGWLFIKDPWDGTSYQMKQQEFLKVWNGEIIFKWNLLK